MTSPGNSQNFDTLDLLSLSGQSPGLGPAGRALLQLREGPELTTGALLTSRKSFQSLSLEGWEK